MKPTCPHIPGSVGALSTKDFEQLISVRECDVCRLNIGKGKTTPCTESDTAPALLNNGYDLLHVLQSKSNISGNFQAFLNPLNIRTWAF